MIPFARLKNDDRALIDMAFSKKKVEDRKEWLRNFTVRSCTMFNHDFAANLILSPERSSITTAMRSRTASLSIRN